MKPTPKQLNYLRALAERTGTTFAWPRTRAEASACIDQLQRRRSSSRTERAVDRTAASDALSEPRGAAVREHEIEGYGSSATWKGQSA